MHQEESSHTGNNPSDESYAAMVLDEVVLTVALDELRCRATGRAHKRVLLDHGFGTATMLPVWAAQNMPHMVPSGDPVSAFELGVLLGLVLADQRKGLGRDELV
jgi:hypothetical protein